MGKVILITFAGREDRMELLRTYTLKLLDKGLLDEWHIWDFTRNDSDREYICENYGPIQYIRPDAGYQQVSTLQKGQYKKLSFSIKSDFHIVVKSKSQSEFFEYVVGGWVNSRSCVRKVSNEEFAFTDRHSAEELFAKDTPGILNPLRRNTAEVRFEQNGDIKVYCEDLEYPLININSDEVDVYIKGGFANSLELDHEDSKIIRFIGDKEISAPYFQCYNYYADRYSSFTDDVFLKCDDDIIYIDVDQFKGYIDCIKRNPQYFFISANVVNNGICAYLQQKAKSIPEEVDHFECPPNGLYGSLWANGGKATKLHEFFVAQQGKTLPLEQELVEWDARIFINFIGWTGDKLRYMHFPQGDDEGMLAVLLPKFLNKKIAVYSNFTVSHLSFFTQEYQDQSHAKDPNKIDPEKIINLYRKLIPS